MDKPASRYGDAWVYESIVGALPGVDLSQRASALVQFVLFEGGLLVVAAIYDLWAAVPAGTAAIVVATIGSLCMSAIATRIREANAPRTYRRLLFGPNVEVVLTVLAFVALVTYLFAFDTGPEPLLTRLVGPDPPILAVYLMLLVCWDLCYRIGTGWWASVTALWRSWTYDFPPEQARALSLADRDTLGFGLLQSLLVPFVLDHPVLLATLAAHVVAMVVVTGSSLLLLRRKGTVTAVSSS
ncbi:MULTISPECIES: hypothetical protein [unclassified Haladaptatus]|uniref:DUF7530 family protein n=1 Tax=unclassified Haladaptatus TaxID=2622732 RepID=UPI0023E88DAB|nr:MULTISPECIES: hypothetical protein [unclassified Haladaptatus]